MHEEQSSIRTRETREREAKKTIRYRAPETQGITCVSKGKAVAEEWRKIDGYDLHEISNTGFVRSWEFSIRDGNNKAPKILSRLDNGKGYKQVTLPGGKKALIHRLVAGAFMDGFDGSSELDHIDGDKENNNINNLRMVTRAENNMGFKRKTKIRPVNIAEL